MSFINGLDENFSFIIIRHSENCRRWSIRKGLGIKD